MGPHPGVKVHHRTKCTLSLKNLLYQTATARLVIFSMLDAPVV